MPDGIGRSDSFLGEISVKLFVMSQVEQVYPEVAFTGGLEYSAHYGIVLARVFLGFFGERNWDL